MWVRIPLKKNVLSKYSKERKKERERETLRKDITKKGRKYNQLQINK